VPAPTPVGSLELPGLPTGRLLLKDDARSCPLYGGNKPRKLEWVLGAARARGARRLVTTGGLGTHHGLATTILGRSLGMATTLVLVDQPMTPGVRESLLLQAAWGARQVPAGGVAGAVAATAGILARSALRGERPFLVATGGSSPRGTLGAVSAGLELAEQVRAGLVPEPASVWVPVGSGGTAAGLALGLRLAGLRSRVTGVLVSDILPPSPRSLARAAGAALRLLRRAGAAVPDAAPGAGVFDWVSDQVGPGYGAPTPAALRARDRAAEAGLRLETTYGAKALAALLRAADGDRLLPGPALFWHTWNGVDVASTAPAAPDPERLPPTLRRRLEAAPGAAPAPQAPAASSSRRARFRIFPAGLRGSCSG